MDTSQSRASTPICWDQDMVSNDERSFDMVNSFRSDDMRNTCSSTEALSMLSNSDSEGYENKETIKCAKRGHIKDVTVLNQEEKDMRVLYMEMVNGIHSDFNDSSEKGLQTSSANKKFESIEEIRKRIAKENEEYMREFYVQLDDSMFSYFLTIKRETS
uniref:Ovate family protein n=1 Tax=Heterorhabditis bacteriophora TaxID=37862 RepID=A0A1I7XAW9_HETBA